MTNKTVKALLTGILNDDDAEVSRIIEACLESEYNVQLEKATKAVMESVGTGKKPIVG